MAGLLRGDTEVAINSLPDTAMYVRNNVGKPIVQIVPKRTELLPSVPTLIESGVPEQVSAKISNVIMSKRTFVGSPNMNPALAELFRKAIYEVTHDPEVVEKAKKTNLTIDYTAPSEDLQNSKEALELMQPFKPMFEQMFK
jgi:tripartite-type tricarboxylate transporter receptor subunit TctC